MWAHKDDVSAFLGTLHYMAVASSPAGPVLVRPVFTLTLKIAHAQTITNRQ